MTRRGLFDLEPRGGAVAGLGLGFGLVFLNFWVCLVGRLDGEGEGEGVDDVFLAKKAVICRC